MTKITTIVEEFDDKGNLLKKTHTIVEDAESPNTFKPIWDVSPYWYAPQFVIT